MSNVTEGKQRFKIIVKIVLGIIVFIFMANYQKIEFNILSYIIVFIVILLILYLTVPLFKNKNYNIDDDKSPYLYESNISLDEILEEAKKERLSK